MAGRSWNSRSLKSRIVTLLAVPIVALIALWIFVAATTLGDALALRRSQTAASDAGLDAAALLAELQHERAVSVAYVGAHRSGGAPLTAQRARTDAALAKLMQAPPGQFDAGARQQTQATLSAALGTLPAGRQHVDAGASDMLRTLDFYNGVIEALYRSAGTFATVSDADLAAQSARILAVQEAAEALAQEDALVRGAIAAGATSPAVRDRLVALVGLQRWLFGRARSGLSADVLAGFDAIATGVPARRLATLEDAVLAERTAAPAAVELPAWSAAYDATAGAYAGFVLTQQGIIVARYDGAADAAIARVAIAGVIGSVAILLTLLLSVRLGQSLIRRLRGLQHAALDLAERRLPGTVARLRRGEPVDPDADPGIRTLGTDEIGRVAEAFNVVQRTAVESAIEEARLRQGIGQVFLNISRRSQSLLHRQLSLLDAIERRTTDPTDLADLFRVDHLAARMRRHAEDLAILTGAAPPRQWRAPVQMVDVIRAAISEIEDYGRIELLTVRDALVHGSAVAHLVHLLAELLENATVFSSPTTVVQVLGRPLAPGYTLEIEDQGIGMSPVEMEAANQRLSRPPEFDPGDSARLGLFVVARLADRLGVTVSLRRSPFGGVSAVVTIPPSLVVAESGSSPESGLPMQLRPADGSAIARASHPVPSALAPVAGGAPEGGWFEPSLPRRDPSAHMAAQLRLIPQQRSAAPPPGRPPERARSAMSSIQQATARARRDALKGAEARPDSEGER